MYNVRPWLGRDGLVHHLFACSPRTLMGKPLTETQDEFSFFEQEKTGRDEQGGRSNAALVACLKEKGVTVSCSATPDSQVWLASAHRKPFASFLNPMRWTDTFSTRLIDRWLYSGWLLSADGGSADTEEGCEKGKGNYSQGNRNSSQIKASHNKSIRVS